MEYELKRSQALVITDTQGSGKNRLAREISTHHGTFTEIDVCELEANFFLGRVLIEEPNTLIVNGFPENKKTIAKIKSWITSGVIFCQRQYREPVPMKSPNIIFLSGSADPLHLIGKDRRFAVIDLDKDNSTMPKITEHVEISVAKELPPKFEFDYIGTPPFANAEWASGKDAMCLWCAGTGHPYGDESLGICKCPPRTTAIAKPS